MAMCCTNLWEHFPSFCAVFIYLLIIIVVFIQRTTCRKRQNDATTKKDFFDMESARNKFCGAQLLN